MGERPSTITMYPQRKDANGVVMRLLDGLGYRFQWATEGLTAEDAAFTPGQGCMTIGELAEHVWGLVNWVHISMLGEGLGESPAPDIETGRRQICRMLYALRTYVSAIDQESLFAIEINGLPFWHIVNGPLSDALTHTGQIALLRRLNGNPVPKHNVFLLHDPQEGE